MEKNQKKPYICIKCQHTKFESKNISVTGSGLAKMFDIQNNTFTAVSCSNCGYTEFYKANTSLGSNILDFLTGS